MNRKIQIPEGPPPRDAMPPQFPYDALLRLTPEQVAGMLKSPHLSEPVKRLARSMAIYGTAAVLVQEDAPDGD